MDIKQSLPFDCCEGCPEFILHVERTGIFSDHLMTWQLEVTCKHETLCRRLKADKQRYENR